MQKEFKLPRKHKVIFKGSLKKFGEFEVAGYTAADCIRGVAIQIPELYTRIMNGYFTVRHRKGKFKEDMTMEMATREIFNYNEQQVIEVIPVVKGATGSQGGDTALIGAGLVIGGILLGVLTMGAGWAATPVLWTTAGAIVSSLATTMIVTGLSLVAGGIASLFAKNEEEKEEEAKYSFNGPTNIAKQGVAVPLIYGKVGVGSNLVSSLVGKIYGTPEFPAGEIGSGVSTTLRITELLGEGEIYGLVDGEKSILLDGVPLVREDGTKTYPNTSVTFCTGVNNVKDPYAEGVNTPIESGSQFEDRVWQTFTVVDPKTDRVNINLRFNALYYQDNKDGHTDMLTTWFEAQVAGEDLVWQGASFNTSGNEVSTVEECVETTIYSKVSTSTFDVGKRTKYRHTHLWTWTDCSGTPKTATQIKEGFYSGKPPKGSSLPKTVTVAQTKQVQTQTSAFTFGSFFVRANTKTTLDLTIQLDIANLDRTKPRYFRIRQLKTTPDKNSYFEDCQLTLYSEQIDLKMNYDGRAVVYMALNAQDFQGNLPARIYEVKGLIIDVPSNYDPETRQYDGIWDGTFKKAWTNNPVWVFYDLLTNGRYGLGRYIGKDNVDKWSLYYASMYCDELVSDGNGGKEPRFTFNGVINSREDAYTVLSNVAGVFRSMLFAANNQIFLAQDAPQTPKRTFGNINVIGGMFNYEGTAATARHTAVEVTWINPDNTWQSEKEIYEDGELIQRYGYNVKSITALGCTSKGQAQRIARHTIYSEEYENDTVTFQVGLQDSDIRPGDIIYIQDEMIAGDVLMGAIKEITTQTIVLDRNIMMTKGQAYSIMLTDNYGNTYVKNLVNREMETDTLWIRSDEFFTQEQVTRFTGASFWTLMSDSVRPRKFRVLSVVEEADEGGAKFTITALLHFDEKYKFIDENISFDRPPISSQPQGELQAPVSFQARQSLKKVEGSVVASADCSWGLPSDVRVSAVEVKISYPNSDGFVDYGLMTDTQLNIENVGVGKMRAKLRSYSNITKTYSQEVEFTKELDSPYVNPPMPMNLTGETVAGVAVFKWDKPFYNFPLTYEYRLITPNGTETEAQTTNNSVSVSRAFNKYPANVAIYVRSVNEVDMMSDYAKTSVNVTPADIEIGDFLEDIDVSWLTGPTQQMLGAGGLLEQISTALMREESYMIYRMDSTDSELAIAVDGLSALTEDHTALASRVTFLGAFVGEQLTSDDPDKFNLKWYDGSDPDYPATPNPLYKPDEPLSVKNYPYLPAYPQQSLAGQLMTVYSSDEFVKAETVTTLDAKFQDSISKAEQQITALSQQDKALAQNISTVQAEFGEVTSTIQQNMVTVVNNKGEVQNDWTVRVDGYNREGQPIIGGFGLHSDGYNTQFGVNAHTFWIRDPEWKGKPDNVFDGYLFVTDVQTNITYIGTENTMFKGTLQSLNYEETKKGFSLNKDGLYEINGDVVTLRILPTGMLQLNHRNDDGSLREIALLGKNEFSDYDATFNIDTSDLNLHGLFVKGSTRDFNQNIPADSEIRNYIAPINSFGGNFAFRDATLGDITTFLSGEKMIMKVGGSYNHTSFQFPNYKHTWISQNLENWQTDIHRIVVGLSYYSLSKLNYLQYAPSGTMLSLPHPIATYRNIREDLWDGSNIFLNTDVWIKETEPVRLVDGTRRELKQPLFDINGNYCYAWYKEMPGNNPNDFACYHPETFSGWRRLTNLRDPSSTYRGDVIPSQSGGYVEITVDFNRSNLYNCTRLKGTPVNYTGNLPIKLIFQ